MLLVVPKQLPTLNDEEACLYILHTYMVKCDDEEYEMGDDMPLNYVALRDILRERTSPALRELHDKGILTKVRKKNSILHQSARYRLASQYFDGTLIECPEWIKKRLKSWAKNNQSKIDNKFKGECRPLYDMRIEKMTDDELWKLVEGRYESTLTERLRRFKRKNMKREKEGKQPLEWNDQRIKDSIFRALKRSYHAIRHKEHYIKDDDRGNRMYSTFTNMPKDLIGKMTLNGRSVITLDISSAQILGLYMFLRNANNEWYYFRQKYKIKGFWPKEKIDIELAKMRVWLANGTFYDQCMRYQVQGDRDRAKKAVLQYLDGRNAMKKSTGHIFFRHELPEIQHILFFIKEIDHKLIYYIMEEMESRIVFGGLLPKVRAARKAAGLNFSYLIKHDSLTIPSKSEDIDLVRQCFREYGAEEDIPLHWKEEHYTR